MATLTFPSNIVWTMGKPKANVFWDDVNMAATTSPRVNWRAGHEKNPNVPARAIKCKMGRKMSSAIPSLTLTPNCDVMAVQKAFHNIPNNTTS